MSSTNSKTLTIGLSHASGTASYLVSQIIRHTPQIVVNTITKQDMGADIFVSHSVSHQSIANIKNAYTSIG